MEKKEFGVSTLFLLERVVWIFLRNEDLNEQNFFAWG